MTQDSFCTKNKRIKTRSILFTILRTALLSRHQIYRSVFTYWECMAHLVPIRVSTVSLWNETRAIPHYAKQSLIGATQQMARLVTMCSKCPMDHSARSWRWSSNSLCRVGMYPCTLVDRTPTLMKDTVRNAPKEDTLSSMQQQIMIWMQPTTSVCWVIQ